jgi:MoaA/NifB/PqqE/SkfB family radical SAM enzyme
MFLSNIKRLKEPYKVNLACTYRCNMRCRNCNIWKRKPESELTVDEIGKVFSNLNIEWLNLTGGEPFLREDLVDIVRAIKERSDPYILNITTNGFLTDKIVSDFREIADMGIPRILCGISVDGPEREHDSLRGMRGSWDRAVSTYKDLISLSLQDLNVFFSYTISSSNSTLFHKTMEDIRERVSDVKKSDFHFNIFHTSEHYYSNPRERSFLSSVPDYLKSVPEGSRFPPAFLRKRYVKHASEYIDKLGTGLKCASLSSSCFIDPYGNVYPCIHFNRNLGSLRDNGYDITRIWKSEDTEMTRKDIAEKKCPGCWTPCEAYQTILANLLH